jgi:UDP-2,3-diacylglucosamine pyrophosphatase LpxH
MVYSEINKLVSDIGARAPVPEHTNNGSSSIHDFSYANLTRLFNSTEPQPIPQDRPIVIFSDFHAGDGSSRDDFLANSDLTMEVLEEYYRRGFRLVLNGDVEELQKFPMKKIRQRWVELYSILERFASEDRLVRLVGNHDLQLLTEQGVEVPVQRALRWEVGDPTAPDSIFIFHGHQASRRYELYNDHVGWLLRNVVGKLPIKNFSVSHDNHKKKVLEERVYTFSRRRRIMSVIGHTHRPLFESLSKTDSVKYNIERLCRQYATAGVSEREAIHGEIHDLKKYLARTVPNRRNDFGSIYHDSFVVPCMFNSGCVLGKRGITCIELSGTEIGLSYWFDRNRSKRYLRYEGYDSQNLAGTSYYETVIQSETLNYIFSRIHLLS